MKEQFSKKKWMEFAKETFENDNEGKKAPSFEGFGNLMEAVFSSQGKIESVLWDTVNPCGTEDRTWVRAYLAMTGNKLYKGIFNGLDGYHAKRIREQFNEVM